MRKRRSSESDTGIICNVSKDRSFAKWERKTKTKEVTKKQRIENEENINKKIEVKDGKEL